MTKHRYSHDFEHLSTAEIAARLNLDIVQESLRQARQSFSLSHRAFQLSLLMTAASGAISLAGVGLLFAGQVSEGAVTAAGGITSSVVFGQLSKEAREQLESANGRLDAIRYELWDGEMTAVYGPYIRAFDEYIHDNSAEDDSYKSDFNAA